jgi:hypothetical protein
MISSIFTKEDKVMVTSPEKKSAAEITWLQCQLPRKEWDALNDRRQKLNLKWADIIVPATQEYIGKLEAQAADAKTKAPALAVANKGSDEKKDASKTKRVKKAPADNSKS